MTCSLSVELLRAMFLAPLFPKTMSEAPIFFPLVVCIIIIIFF